MALDKLIKVGHLKSCSARPNLALGYQSSVPLDNCNCCYSLKFETAFSNGGDMNVCGDILDNAAKHHPLGSDEEIVMGVRDVLELQL